MSRQRRGPARSPGGGATLHSLKSRFRSVAVWPGPIQGSGQPPRVLTRTVLQGTSGQGAQGKARQVQGRHQSRAGQSRFNFSDFNLNFIFLMSIMLGTPTLCTIESTIGTAIASTETPIRPRATSWGVRDAYSPQLWRKS